jgi:large subunit ribosomal protein L13
MGTYFAKKEDVTRKWYLIDATDLPIGRLAVEVAKILRGKNKPTFTPHVDTGDHVIVINAAKIKMTGTNKSEELIYWHTGYPGGIKSISRGKMLDKQPVKLLMKVVKGMLPHNKLGDDMLLKLRVHPGDKHNHEAQKPEVIKI